MKKLTSILCAVFTLSAFAGQERGGGDEFEREFVKMAMLASKVIGYHQQHATGLFDGFDLAAFNKAINEVEAYALPKVCEPDQTNLSTGGVTKGRCLDAQYLPAQGRIEFDKNRWNKKTCMQMVALTIHEYGRASNNEDGNYKYSSRVDQANINNSCDEIDRQRKKIN